jgi:hypothetical protein
MNLKHPQTDRVWRGVDGAALLDLALDTAEQWPNPTQRVAAQVVVLSQVLGRILDRFPDDVALRIALPNDADIWEMDTRTDEELENA